VDTAWTIEQQNVIKKAPQLISITHDKTFENVDPRSHGNPTAMGKCSSCVAQLTALDSVGTKETQLR